MSTVEDMLKSTRWRTRLDNYKGGSFPPPAIPLTGFVLGPILVYSLYHHVIHCPDACTELTEAERIGLFFRSLPPVALVFAVEFFLGAAARSTSAKASAEPAGIVAAGMQPYAVIQANRILQNHIESAAMFVPTLACLAALGGDTPYNPRLLVPALSVSWTIGRVMYRVGYMSVVPFRRITGVTMTNFWMSVVPLMYCLYRFGQEFLMA